MAKSVAAGVQIDVGARFEAVRRRTLALCEPLTPEDMMVQSCPEASPAKWHLAHTAWFFESFILNEFLPGYRLFNADFQWLFNSYYQSFSAIPEKRLRAAFSRPGLDEVLRYREHVDQAIARLLDSDPGPEPLRRLELGVNHEEQHQELMLTDILNAFFTDPLRPAYMGRKLEDRPFSPSLGRSLDGEGFHGNFSAGRNLNVQTSAPPAFQDFPGGLHEAGHTGDDFCFDSELPRHRVWLEPYSLATRLVTCAEYAAFIADGGYRRPDLWLSDGWAAVESNGWGAPLYWTQGDGDHGDGGWSVFTLRGPLPLKELETAPVGQVSFFEADAYARWAGHRLPTEFEWEAAAEGSPVEGNLLDSGLLTPGPAKENQGRAQHYGDCWQWTASAYLGYPGFHPLAGTLGEYNGKFMSGQMVLRGGSCVTPADHIRSSYRNFFPPETRWQFSGIRLAT